MGRLPSFIQLPAALALECIKFVMGRDSAPDSAGELIQRSPRPLSWFKGGPTSKRREGKRKRRKEIGDEREREGKGRMGRKAQTPLHQFLRSPLARRGGTFRKVRWLPSLILLHTLPLSFLFFFPSTPLHSFPSLLSHAV